MAQEIAEASDIQTETVEGADDSAEQERALAELQERIDVAMMEFLMAMHATLAQHDDTHRLSEMAHQQMHQDQKQIQVQIDDATAAQLEKSHATAA